MDNIPNNTCNAYTKRGRACQNHSMKNSEYCYPHTFGRIKGTPWYRNATYQLLITIALSITLFLIGPSQCNQKKMLKNDEETHNKLDTINGKLSEAIDSKKDTSSKKMSVLKDLQSKEITNNKPVDEITKLVSTLEELLSEDKAEIKSPDYIEDKITGELRKVDISINKIIGSVSVLIIIECKDNSILDDTLWIEQIAQKRDAIKASKAVAVFSGYLSDSAAEKASHLNIGTRLISKITLDDISDWFQAQYMTEWVYHVDFLRVTLRAEKDEQKKLDNFIKSNFFNKKLDTNENIFLNTADNKEYSLDHVWRGILSKKRKEIYSGVNQTGEKVRRTLFSSFSNPKSRYQIITDNGPVDILEIRKTCDLWIEENRVPFALSQYSSKDDQLVDSVGAKIEANGIVYNFNIHKNLKTGQMYLSGDKIADIDFNFVEVEKDGISESTGK